METVSLIEGYAFEIPEFLPPAECEALIARAEAIGFEPATVETSGAPRLQSNLRNNDRVTVDDHGLAARFWDRLRPAMADEFKGRRPVGVNERMRFYRYDPGQRFDWHRDGTVDPGDGRVSQFTFMIYLNAGYEGGGTSFRVPGEGEFATVPRQGLALLFHHPLAHRGDAVTAGRKYVLRSDVMYDARVP